MTALSRLYETERDLRESERGLRCVSETAVRVTERDDSESQMYMMCPLFATKTQMSEGSVALAPKKLGRPLPDYVSICPICTDTRRGARPPPPPPRRAMSGADDMAAKRAEIAAMVSALRLDQVRVPPPPPGDEADGGATRGAPPARPRPRPQAAPARPTARGGAQGGEHTLATTADLPRGSWQRERDALKALAACRRHGLSFPRRRAAPAPRAARSQRRPARTRGGLTRACAWRLRCPAPPRPAAAPLQQQERAAADKEKLQEQRAQFFGTHEGVHCDGCGTGPIVGYRYKCKRCQNHDICESCYDMHRLEGKVRRRHHSPLSGCGSCPARALPSSWTMTKNALRDLRRISSLSWRWHEDEN